MNQIRIGAVLSYLGILATMAVAIFYTPILVDKLGQAEYGVYTLIGAFVGYLTILDMGLGNAIVRYIARARAQNDNKYEAKLIGMFIVMFSILGAIVAIAGAILYIQIDSLFATKLTVNEIELAKTLAIILIVNFVISFPLSVFGAIIHAYEKFVFIKFTGIIRTIITPLVIVPMLFLGYGSITVVLLTTLLNIFFLLLNIYYAFQKLHIKIIFAKFDNTLLKEIVIYSAFIFLNAIIDKIYWSTDQIIIGATLGVNDVAIYAIAMQFIMIYITLSTAIGGLFLPKVSIMEVNGATHEQFSHLFIRVGKVQSFIMVPTLISFYIIGKEFITLWVGDTYSEAYYIVLVIMIPLAIVLCQNVGIAILQAKNLHGFRSIVYFLIACLNIAVSIPVAEYFGITAVGIVTAISLTLGNIIIINFYYKIKLKLDVVQFWQYIIPFIGVNIVSIIIISFITNLMINDGIFQVILDLVLYLIAIVSITFGFFVEKSDKEKIIKKILKK